MRSLIAVAVLVALAGCSGESLTSPTYVEPQPVASVAPAPAASPTAVAPTLATSEDPPPPVFELGIILEPDGGWCRARITSNMPADAWPTVQWFKAADRADPNGSKILFWEQTFYIPQYGTIDVHPDCCHFGLVQIRVKNGMWKWHDYGDRTYGVCW